MHDHSVLKSVVDWLLTLLLAFWGFLISMFTTKDWITILSVLLLLLKIAHEAFRFWQSCRPVKRRQVESDEVA